MRRRRQRQRSVAVLAIVLALLATCIVSVSAAGETCSATQKCPESSPCCGPGGTCGSGALQCAGGCQPMMSFAATSCLPNPICTNKDINFAPTDYNNPHQFYPILLYNGNASAAPFTLDYGSLGQGPKGVLLQLQEQSQTRLSTTDYMLYGNISLTARHTAMAGLVFAFITMGDTKDEIDWEFTTADASDLQTNYFAQGVTAKGTAASVNSSSISVNDWHTYGLQWSPDALQWSIDGNTMRTVSRNKAGENFPRSPSRVQISIWAGGNSTNPPGVVQWAGGAIDWTQDAYTQQGFYSAEISAYTQTCASQSASGVATQGTGDVTSWVYTGEQDASLGEPGFVMSTAPITYLKHPSQDGHPNMPGYEDQTAFTKDTKNAWDGSGDTSNLPKSVTDAAQSGSNNDGSSSDSDSGGWLANNRALSIAVPVVGAVVVVAVLWGLCVWLWRKMRRNNPGATADDDGSNNYGSGIKGGNGMTQAATSSGRAGMPVSSGIAGGRSSSYHKLKNVDEDDDYYDENGDMGLSRGQADDVPMGAQQIGRGLGPAAGPRPGRQTMQMHSVAPAAAGVTLAGVAEGAGVTYHHQRPGSHAQDTSSSSRSSAASGQMHSSAPPRSQASHSSHPSHAYPLRPAYNAPAINAAAYASPPSQSLRTPAMRGVFASPAAPGAMPERSPYNRQGLPPIPQQQHYAHHPSFTPQPPQTQNFHYQTSSPAQRTPYARIETPQQPYTARYENNGQYSTTPSNQHHQYYSSGY